MYECDCLFVCLIVCIYVCLFVFMFACMFVRMFVLYVCLFVCIYVCMCLATYESLKNLAGREQPEIASDIRPAGYLVIQNYSPRQIIPAQLAKYLKIKNLEFDKYQD